MNVTIDANAIALASIALPILIGFGLWLIKLQTRVGNLEKDFGGIRDDVAEIKTAQTGFRESLHRIDLNVTKIAASLHVVEVETPR